MLAAVKRSRILAGSGECSKTLDVLKLLDL
jgi:hypothetical protein